MDNLTHSLAGAILGQMGLKRKTALAMPTLIIAANIPDIDAAATLLGGVEHLAIRRGLTHGPIALLVLPVLLWLAMLGYARWRKREGVQRRWLLALAYFGTLSHPALDWLNSYGIRFLEPFSSQWFAGDTIFIIDVWIWSALAWSVWLSRRRERAGHGDWTRPAWMGFAAVCTYIFANGLITSHAEAETKNLVMARYQPTASQPDPLVVANPVPVMFWQRELLWRDDVHYGDGTYTLAGGALLKPGQLPHGMNNPRVAAFTANDDPARAFLFWARMPVASFATQAGVETLTIRDQRFMHPLAQDRFKVEVRTEAR